MRYRVAILIAVVLMATSCFKKVTTDTNLIVKTLIQEKSGGANVATADVLAYAYYTDSERWMVANYEDALNRIVTDSLGVERKTVPDVEATPFSREGDLTPYMSLPLNSSPALVVVVYPAAKIYATLFKHLNVDNLPQTYMTLLLHTWKDAPYTEGSVTKGGVWNIVPPAKVDEKVEE